MVYYQNIFTGEEYIASYPEEVKEIDGVLFIKCCRADQHQKHASWVRKDALKKIKSKGK